MGTPWGMIQARNDRDHLNIKLRDLRKMVFATVDEALAELEKPDGSKDRIAELLRRLRTDIN